MGKKLRESTRPGVTIVSIMLCVKCFFWGGGKLYDSFSMPLKRLKAAIHFIIPENIAEKFKAICKQTRKLDMLSKKQLQTFVQCSGFNHTL